MKIEKILFPTKFRDLAFNALESLLDLRKTGLKEVLLQYVIPREDVGFVPYGGYLKEEEERIRHEARIRFQDWQKTLTEQGIESRIIIEVGEPVPNILALAEKEQVDLVVVGRKKKVAHEHSLVGSHTHQIITRCKAPTLVSKYMVQFDWNGEMVTRTNKNIFQRPLIATDWSEPSEKALQYLTAFGPLIEKAFVCHVMEVKIHKGMKKTEVCRIERETKKRLDGYCRKLKAAGINAEPHLGAGRTTPELIRISRDLEATLTVIGTTGKDRLHEFFLGSNSHRLAELSELPTLLVP